MVTKNVQPVTVIFDGGLPDKVFEKAALEPAGLVVFEEESVRLIPWHRILEVRIGRHA